VLELLALGLPNKTIAQRLRISEHTAKFHVGSIMAKLGAASRTEAVALAARRGLLVL
jgi:DNA-binding NarL/FixJ family response regulator